MPSGSAGEKHRHKHSPAVSMPDSVCSQSRCSQVLRCVVQSVSQHSVSEAQESAVCSAVSQMKQEVLESHDNTDSLWALSVGLPSS